MVITSQGDESFKISQGELTIAVNPKAKASADITLFSTKSELSGDAPEKAGFVVDGPGEYEVKGVTMKGFLSKSPDSRLNTIYMLDVEGMNLCFLGRLGGADLPAETLENLEGIDILFTPVDSHKLAVSLEAKVLIPTGYTSESLKKFVKEAGEDAPAELDKLVVKRKDLEGKEGDIIVLKEE